MSELDIVQTVPQRTLKVFREQYYFDPPMLGAWLSTAIQTPRWLITDYLPADSNVLISGPPKKGKKSYMAFDMALCVASGKTIGPFKSESGMATPVLILEAEGSNREAAQRIARVSNGARLDPYELPIYFSHRQNLVINHPEWAHSIASFVKLKGIKLVIVDTLRMYMKGDENNSEAVSEATRGINQIREAGASVIFIHHVTKSTGQKDPDDEIRGSSAIAGFYDVHYAIRVKEGQNFENLLVRSKDDGDRYFEIFWSFEGTDDQEAAILELVPVTAEKRLARVADEILMALSATDRPLHPGTLRKNLDLSEEKVNECLDYLVQIGTIYKSARGYLLSSGVDHGDE